MNPCLSLAGPGLTRRARSRVRTGIAPAEHSAGGQNAIRQAFSNRAGGLMAAAATRDARKRRSKQMREQASGGDQRIRRLGNDSPAWCLLGVLVGGMYRCLLVDRAEDRVAVVLRIPMRTITKRRKGVTGFRRRAWSMRFSAIHVMP